MSTQGTIEAWVYVKQHTDTGGTVHKGERADFLDEILFPAILGNNGQVAFVIDGAGGGNNYDLVTSSINLNTGAWYYLAATWDNQVATSPKYMRLYVNGVLRGSSVPTLTAAHSSTSLHRNLSSDHNYLTSTALLMAISASMAR